jgi:hypothetical protein
MGLGAAQGWPCHLKYRGLTAVSFGMRLRSILHRVVPVAEMEPVHRFFIAYFCRPAHGTRFRDLERRMIACDEWFSRKLDVYRATHEEQRRITVLPGGIESAESRGRAVIDTAV